MANRNPQGGFECGHGLSFREWYSEGSVLALLWLVRRHMRIWRAKVRRTLLVVDSFRVRSSVLGKVLSACFLAGDSFTLCLCLPILLLLVADTKYATSPTSLNILYLGLRTSRG